MTHNHCIVWLDHAEARLYSFNRDDVEMSRIRSQNPHKHLHHKAGVIGSGHAGDDKAYFDKVAEALDESKEILVVGPSNAKTALIHHIQAHKPGLAKKIVGTETLDHPTDGQLVAYARKYFRAADRMLPNA